MLEIPESIKTSNSRVAQVRELWWQDLKRCCSANAAHRLSTVEAIRMVCVFSPGLWQPNACVSETDNDDQQAIRAHESCLTSEYIFLLCCIILLLMKPYKVSLDSQGTPVLYKKQQYCK